MEQLKQCDKPPKTKRKFCPKRKKNLKKIFFEKEKFKKVCARCVTPSVLVFGLTLTTSFWVPTKF
jgi:hypothetical protein